MLLRFTAATAIVGAIAAGPCVAADRPCEPHWSDDFPTADLNGPAYSLATYDDGSGPALYVGGSFSTAAGLAVNRIAKWDGRGWSSLGNGFNGPVYALAVFDDGLGGGPALIAGGRFTTASGTAASNIARWDSRAWSALGAGVCCGLEMPVCALLVHDDGTGSALFVGGEFASAGGQPASRIAKWDGASWSALGSGMTGGFGLAVSALCAFDDGSGLALFAGGSFTMAGGTAVKNIARWNGRSWSSLGSGICCGSPLARVVNALATFDDGTGTALFAAGGFTSAGDSPAPRIARWDGTGWSTLSGGIGGDSSSVLCLGVLNGNSRRRPSLIAGGYLQSAGGAPASGIAAWDGQSWSALGPGINPSRTVRALLTTDVRTTSGEPVLVAAGEFTTAGAVAARSLATWNGSAWSSLGSPGMGMDAHVRAMKVVEHGPLAGVYAGGVFESAGVVAAGKIARWDGGSWTTVGSGLAPLNSGSAVYDMVDADESSPLGPALYAAGSFLYAGVTTVNRIARWDGRTWLALGLGVDDSVQALTLFQPQGEDPVLVAGGWFLTAGGVAALRVAQWNGSAWSPFGTGLGLSSQSVQALAVYDDGSGRGPELYAGGTFTRAGTVVVNRFVKWNGTIWQQVGTGVGGAFGVSSESFVGAFAVFDDGRGGGPALYLLGSFTHLNPVPAPGLARWDGRSLEPVTHPFSDLSISGMIVFDDGLGSGPALYLSGRFATDSQTIRRLARWDGRQWTVLPGQFVHTSGTSMIVRDLAAAPGGLGVAPVLYFGGGFLSVASLPSENVAALVGCAPSPAADLNGDGVVNSLDLGLLLVAWSIPAEGPGCGGAADCPADLNGDGFVNALDLGILLASWTLQF